MNLRRVGVLLGKDILHGPKNFIVVFAVVAPIIISLLISLIFGTFFTQKPNLGFVDQGDSQMVEKAYALSTINVTEYATVDELRKAVESGTLDVGMVVPSGFDDTLILAEEAEISVYVRGESLLKNLTIIEISIIQLIRDMTGEQTPVTIASITLGGEESIPWVERLLPFVVMIAVFLGGLMIPATSLITEKEKHTLNAVSITPASFGDIFVSKAILGIILSLLMGIIILFLNSAFPAEPGLLVMVLFLGAIMAAEFGLLLGILLKDISTLFTVWKFGGLILFFPVFLYIFPEIPEWVGMIFPTYYFIKPIVDISQYGGGWPEIAVNVIVLIGLNVLLAVALMLLQNRQQQYAT